MAHKKSASTTKNGRDSQSKRLGIKVTPGALAKKGFVLVRQRGTAIMAGTNVSVGKDHTLFALKPGTVKFSSKRKTSFNGKTAVKKVVNVI